LTAFNAISQYFPFAKIVTALAMPESGRFDFVINGTLRDDGYIQSTTSQKATNIESVFIFFHLNYKSKVICIQSFITNFNLTAEGTSVQKYPSGDIENEHLE
jgi:hypothetical protein